MAQHFLDECGVLFNSKAKNTAAVLQTKLQEANTALNELRQQFYAVVEASWNDFVISKTADVQALQKVSNASRNMALKARALVQELYPYCGMTGADTTSAINRTWRDIFTASQHSLLHFPAA